MQIALNGNSLGPTDPNFIHFADEQTGVMLPSCPGYPNWLPQLQITLQGRLCFWNFPAWIYKTACNISGTQTTSQWLRDAKAVSANNEFPPIPADKLGTNGSGNQYFWGSCNTYFIVDQNFYNFRTGLEALREYIGIQEDPNSPAKGSTYAAVLQQVQSVAGWFPKPGQYMTLNPWQWIALNIQYYLNRYLNIPFDINAGGAYADSWITILMNQSMAGGLAGWLSVCNFMLQPQGKPSTFESVANILPQAILGIVGGVLVIASAGALTPEFATAIGAMSAAVKKSNAQTAQSNATAAYFAANAGVNTSQISADTSAILNPVTNPLSNLTSSEQQFLLFAFIGILLLILFLYKTK